MSAALIEFKFKIQDFFTCTKQQKKKKQKQKPWLACVLLLCAHSLPNKLGSHNTRPYVIRQDQA